jgi:hypothetical protein
MSDSHCSTRNSAKRKEIKKVMLNPARGSTEQII